MRLLALLGVVLSALLAGAASAQAVEYTVDFQTGPPLGQAIESDYEATAFVRWVRDDPGYRPARRAVSGPAIAADIGAARCVPEGGVGNDCEFPTGGTTLQLTNTASSVAVRAGLFAAAGDAVTVQLRAFRAGAGVPVATSAATPIGTAFTTTTSVTDGAGLIQRVEVVVGGNGAQGAQVGIDDLVVDVPPGRSPDVGVTAPQDTFVVPQGGQVDVPLTVVRVNGSNGDLAGTVTGLPTGTTATVLPDPIAGTGGSATLRVTAAADAPPDFAGQPATVTLTPAGAAVAPAPRSVGVRLSVRAPFTLAAPGGPHLIGRCGSVDVPVTVARDGTFAAAQTVTLSADGVLGGLAATFVEGATIPPGGGFTATRTLRLTRTGAATLPTSAFTVRATAPGAPARAVTVTAATASSTAALDTSTPRGSVPSRLGPGGRLRLTGNGFCPGTVVQVGNSLATAPLTLETPTAGSFEIPRLATSGPITVVAPGGASYSATGAATIDSPRTFNGFAFDNPGWGNLSFSELRKLVGDEDLFLQINPCWPIYDCSTPSPIPDPVALAVWQGIEQAAQSSGGHCFGITRFVQEVGARRIRPSDFEPGKTTAYSMTGPNGPSGRLGSYLDGRHAAQFTEEFIGAWLSRSESIPVNLNRMREELTNGRLPGVIVKPSLFSGHVMVVQDIETRPDGETWLRLYDNEHPFVPEEETDRDGSTHEAEEAASRVVISADKRSWSYGGWTGDGTYFMALRLRDVPEDPDLPGLGTLARATIFGAAGGSAVSGPPSRGVDVVPALDPNGVPGAAGTLVPRRGTSVVEHTMRGRKAGSYTQTALDGGDVSVVEVPTAKGVRDTLRTSAGDVRFAGSADRPLTLEVGSRARSASRLATLQMRTSAGGSDTVSLRGRTVEHRHAGAPTRVRLRLEAVTRGKGVATLDATVPVGRGDRLRVTPASWTTLRRARVVVRSAAGRTRVRTVRSRSGLRAKVALGGLGVRGRIARATLRVGRLPQLSTGGVVLHLQRGGRTVARRGVALPGLRRGARRVTLRLPARLPAGRYRLRAQAVVSATGDRPGTRRVSRSAAVRVR